jgi:hypothetical protein
MPVVQNTADQHLGSTHLEARVTQLISPTTITRLFSLPRYFSFPCFSFPCFSADA